jgi:hypothetical protein
MSWYIMRAFAATLTSMAASRVPISPPSLRVRGLPPTASDSLSSFAAKSSNALRLMTPWLSEWPTLFFPVATPRRIALKG